MRNCLRIIGVALLFILSAISLTACGGGGGGGGNTPENSVTANEIAVKAKAQQILPEDVYQVFIENLDTAKTDPDYDTYLTELSKAIDEYNAAVTGQQTLMLQMPIQPQNLSPKILSLMSTQSALDQMKSTLSSVFGDIVKAGKRMFLNAGMGWGYGVIGGPGGQLSLESEVLQAGVDVVLKGGKGLETTYDFLNFTKITSPVATCSLGAGISLGAGLSTGITGNAFVEAIYNEKWIFGFVKNAQYNGGPSVGGNASVGVTGDFLGRLGLAASFGLWQEREGTCDTTILSCITDGNYYSGNSTGKHGVNWAVGGKASIVPAVDLKVSLSGAGTRSCQATPSEVVSFLSSSVSDIKHRRILAGFIMATDLLKHTYFPTPTQLLASATAILYGILYDESLIDTTIPISPPSTPSDFVVTPTSSSQINLSWNASTGATSYNVYKEGIWLKSVTTTSTSDTGLTPSTNYCYYVTAYNSAGESAQSGQICATTNTATTVGVSGSWYGDWEHTTLVGTIPVKDRWGTILATVNQVGAALSGYGVLVDGSRLCFTSTSISGIVSGSISGNSVAWSLASQAGASFDFSGTLSGNTISGTYSIIGGVCNGESGTGTIDKLTGPTTMPSGVILIQATSQTISFTAAGGMPPYTVTSSDAQTVYDSAPGDGSWTVAQEAGTFIVHIDAGINADVSLTVTDANGAHATTAWLIVAK